MKIHLLYDGQDLPLHFHLTAGQTHEAQALEQLLRGADEAVMDAEGCLVTRPQALAGDKRYCADWIDQLLLELDIFPVIPSKATDDRDKRCVMFDSDVYRRRNIIERLVGQLKESRRILPRLKTTAFNFDSMIKLAFIQRYLRTRWA